MDPNTILHIIEMLLMLGVDAEQHIPAANKEAFWVRHEARVEFWHQLFLKVSQKD